MKTHTTNHGLPEGAGGSPGSVGEEEVWFACQRCTNCCRWPGQVRLTDADIAGIAKFLKLSEWDFIQRHTRMQSDRRGLALLEREDGSCEFLSGSDCLLQSVKPAQCQGFPNIWNFPGWRDVCEAVPVPRKKESPATCG